MEERLLTTFVIKELESAGIVCCWFFAKLSAEAKTFYTTL